MGFGLINEVAPEGELDSTVDRWLAARLSLPAIEQTICSTGQLPPDRAQALRLPAVVACLATEDGEEDVRAFRDRRAPVWSGR